VRELQKELSLVKELNEDKDSRIEYLYNEIEMMMKINESYQVSIDQLHEKMHQLTLKNKDQQKIIERISKGHKSELSDIELTFFKDRKELVEKINVEKVRFEKYK